MRPIDCFEKAKTRRQPLGQCPLPLFWDRAASCARVQSCRSVDKHCGKIDRVPHTAAEMSQKRGVADCLNRLYKRPHFSRPMPILADLGWCPCQAGCWMLAGWPCEVSGHQCKRQKNGKQCASASPSQQQKWVLRAPRPRFSQIPFSSRGQAWIRRPGSSKATRHSGGAVP